HLRELFRGDRAYRLALRHLVARARVYALYDVPRARTDEREHGIHLFGGLERYLPAFDCIVDLEVEAALHVGIYDQSGSVERVGEHPENREIEGSRVGLVHHEYDDWLGAALDEFEFGHAGAHAADVARERVLEQILPRPVQLELLGDL